MTYEYLILGAGITGLTLLKKCAKKELIIFWHWKPKKRPAGFAVVFMLKAMW